MQIENTKGLRFEEVRGFFGHREYLNILQGSEVIARFYYNMTGYNQDFDLVNADGVHWGFGGDRSKAEQVREFKAAIRDGFNRLKPYR